MENNKKIKLTQYSSGAGWACKINAKDLTQVLGKLKTVSSSKISGYEKFDDCAIYPIDNKKSIIQILEATAIHQHGEGKSIKNSFKRTFIINFNMTYSELYYYFKINNHYKKFSLLGMFQAVALPVAIK